MTEPLKPKLVYVLDRAIKITPKMMNTTAARDARQRALDALAKGVTVEPPSDPERVRQFNEANAKIAVPVAKGEDDGPAS